HTMMVSMLSERAAAEVGANLLLCRVGAYFHDIGKTPNSQFFTHNQGKENPHDRLDPTHSARIIAGHVIDGLAIGRSNRIPQAVLNFIPEHHGTTMMHYFYDKEKNLEDEDQIKDDNFRYPGPKPQSKETAIVMLADGVEASVRSLTEPTEESIRKITETVVEKRLDEGQFSECPITFAEINMVKESFIKTLMAAYHKRIKYPGQQL
ncbi:MAG: HDIG domain-containing protein, partial [Chlorobiales bacterium]|nr:HDIG domain-containing protein [Chlorobiales bacterium]